MAKGEHFEYLVIHNAFPYPNLTKKLQLMAMQAVGFVNWN